MDWLGGSVITSTISMKNNCIAWKTNLEKANIYSYAPFSRHCEYDYNEKKISTDNDLKYSQAVLKHIHSKTQLPGLNLVYYSENGNTLMAGKGLSSSAALCVSTAAIATKLSNQPENAFNNYREYCAESAYQAENGVLGINCGRMDPYACAIGGTNTINCANDSVNFITHQGLENMDIIIGDTGVEKDTPKILDWLKRRYEERETTINIGISKIQGIVEKASMYLSNGSDYRKLGALIDDNQEYLKDYILVSGDCPISKSSLDELITAAKKAGAYGAKLTGSGGGGCMIALSNPKKTSIVCNEILEVGGIPYRTKLTKSGLTLKDMRVQSES
jgi:mevalonate kinase